MKKLIYILFILVVTAAGLWFARKKIYRLIVTTHVNQEMPDFRLQGLDGGRIELSVYRGKLLVLDFWTTWCGVCKQAFPDFQELAAKYKSTEDVVFLAVNTSQGGDSIDKVRAFMQKSGYTFPVAFDSAAVLSDRLDIKYYPTLLIVDSTGAIRLKHIGYSKSFEDYREIIERHVETLLAEAKKTDSQGSVEIFLDLENNTLSKKVRSWLNKLGFGKSSPSVVCILSIKNGMELHCKFLHHQKIET